MYFITPNYSVALVTKAGSSSIATAIIKQYYPEMWDKLLNAAYPPGKGVYDLRLHTRCQREQVPSKPVVLGVRNPVDRFISAVAWVNLGTWNMDEVLDSLESRTPIVRPSVRNKEFIVQDNEHFTHQHLLQYNETHLFKFPTNANDLATFIGVDSPLPTINEGIKPEPTLLSSHILRVQDYYAKDIELFNSITQANTIVTVDPETLKPTPKEPVPGQVTPLQIRKWLILHGISMPMIDAALSSISDPTVRQIAQAEWEFGLTVERSNPMINQFGSFFGLTPSAMDQAFREAATFYI